MYAIDFEKFLLLAVLLPTAIFWATRAGEITANSILYDHTVRKSAPIMTLLGSGMLMGHVLLIPDPERMYMFILWSGYVAWIYWRSFLRPMYYRSRHGILLTPMSEFALYFVRAYTTCGYIKFYTLPSGHIMLGYQKRLLSSPHRATFHHTGCIHCIIEPLIERLDIYDAESLIANYKEAAHHGRGVSVFLRPLVGTWHVTVATFRLSVLCEIHSLSA